MVATQIVGEANARLMAASIDLLEACREFVAKVDRGDARSVRSDQDAVQAELQRVAGDIRAKGAGLAIVLQGLDRLADWQRAEGQRLMAKARANEAHAERLKAYALSCLQSLGIERLETGTHTLSVRTNPLSVQVVDESTVPDEFMRTVVTTSVDKRAILTHVKQTGEVIPGVAIQRSQSLRVA